MLLLLTKVTTITAKIVTIIINKKFYKKKKKLQIHRMKTNNIWESRTDLVPNRMDTSEVYNIYTIKIIT